MLGNATCEQSCSLTFSFSDIRIIGKGRRIQMKKIAHLLLGRFSIVAVSIILQFLWLVMVMYQFSYQFTYANLAIRTIAIIVVLVIVNRWTNPANKLSWTFIILLSPVLGLLLYMIFGRSSLTKKTQERMDSVNREVSACLYQTPEIKEQLEREDLSVYRQSRYINDWAGFPLYHNTSTKYYSCGEEMFPDMLADLEKAEHFIFLEYFIVEKGYMWAKVLEVLQRKVAEGVEVRLMYDGTCAFNYLPYRYPDEIKKMGIQCKMFSPILPILSTHYNNRDHRKILVIDGKVGFTGGVNIGDEYINRRSPFGHWKDTAIMLEGDGVEGLTQMFLQMWNVTEKCEDFGKYLQKENCGIQDDSGFILPFGDSPFDRELIGETVYMDIINRAEDYVHIMTPYLIIDHEMETALCYAAKRGVDVKLILPHIPDKKMPFALAKTHYPQLLKAGVRIFEYTPGFVHAKVFSSDGRKAVVGTINLDYRSLYLHFECGAFLFDLPVIGEIEEDFQNTLAKCQEMTMADYRKGSMMQKVCGKALKLLAPLM